MLKHSPCPTTARLTSDYGFSDFSRNVNVPLTRPSAVFRSLQCGIQNLSRKNLTCPKARNNLLIGKVGLVEKYAQAVDEWGLESVCFNCRRCTDTEAFVDDLDQQLKLARSPFQGIVESSR